MIAIIGLGNPGREYNWTRHNIGFEVVGKLAYDNDINMNKEKYKAIVGEGRIGNEKVLLIQPLTYMNLSGDSVREFVNFYKLSPEEIIYKSQSRCRRKACRLGFSKACSQQIY